jgi:hypothetical protein
VNYSSLVDHSFKFATQFSGHAVIPSLARDMVNPEEFDKMINLAFVRCFFRTFTDLMTSNL